MSRVIVFGTGRGAEIAYRYFRRDGMHDVVGFTVDRAFRTVERFHDLPVVDFESVERTFPPAQYQMFALLGYQRMNRLRQEKYQAGKEKGYQFVSYVSPRIAAQPDLVVGENCLILDHQTIDLDVTIGNNVVMWSSNHIGDMTHIMDHVWISSGLCTAGNVTIGAFSFVGVNVVITSDVKVQEGSFLGAGAVITKDTVRRGVYVVPSTPAAPMDSDRFMSIIGENR